MAARKSPQLRKAEAFASAVPGLHVREAANGVLHWRWIASPTQRKAGWDGMQLGTDRDEAIRKAEARNAEIAVWRTGGARPDTVRALARRHTVAALIDQFKRKHLVTKRKNTQRTYTTSLNRIEGVFADIMVGDVRRKHVWDFRDALTASGLGPDAVHGTLRVMRTLFKFAAKHEWIGEGQNPATDFDMPIPPPRDVVIWPHLRQAMIDKADVLGWPGMGDAIMLGFAIGQREADLLALVRSQWTIIPRHKIQASDWEALAAMASDNTVRGLRLRQFKTSAWVEVPVVGQDRNRIEAALARGQSWASLNILNDDKNQGPFHGDGGQRRFQRRWEAVREACAIDAEQAGDAPLADELRGIQFRDLRRTAVVYLGELGLDAHLIASITGHDIDETQRILKTYMPLTTGRAAAAIAIRATRAAANEQADRKEQQR